MNEELRLAMEAELNARSAYNALPEDATEDAVTAAEAALREASDALGEALKKAKEPERPALHRDLAEGLELREYMSCYAEGRRLEGRSAEVNQELGLNDMTQIPMEALLPPEEERADVVTQTGDLPSNSTLHAIMPRVFQETLAARLGITMPGVGAGQQDYPVITGGTTAAPVGETARHDAAKVTFATKSVNPTRITARYVWTLEDIARIGSQLESALRADIRNALGDQLDAQIISGDGAAPNFSGITKLVAASPAVVKNAGAVATWDDLKLLAVNRLDGRFARTESAVRVALGLNTYKLGRNLYKANATDLGDAIDGARATGASVFGSSRIPAEGVGDKTKAEFRGYEGAIITSEPGAAVAPIWQGVTMIRDPYSSAAEGQIELTIAMLAGFTIKRLDGWTRVNLIYKSGV